jgi:hypothetical protein
MSNTTTNPNIAPSQERPQMSPEGLISALDKVKEGGRNLIENKADLKGGYNPEKLPEQMKNAAYKEALVNAYGEDNITKFDNELEGLGNILQTEVGEG